MSSCVVKPAFVPVIEPLATTYYPPEILYQFLQYYCGGSDLILHDLLWLRLVCKDLSDIISNVTLMRPILEKTTVILNELHKRAAFRIFDGALTNVYLASGMIPPTMLTGVTDLTIHCLIEPSILEHAKVAVLRVLVDNQCIFNSDNAKYLAGMTTLYVGCGCLTHRTHFSPKRYPLLRSVYTVGCGMEYELEWGTLRLLDYVKGVIKQHTLTINTDKRNTPLKEMLMLSSINNREVCVTERLYLMHEMAYSTQFA